MASASTILSLVNGHTPASGRWCLVFVSLPRARCWHPLMVRATAAFFDCLMVLSMTAVVAFLFFRFFFFRFLFLAATAAVWFLFLMRFIMLFVLGNL